MLDQLLNVVQQYAQDAVVKNQDVPNQHNDAVQQEVFGAIQNGLSSAISNGNLADVMGLFSSGAQQQNIANNPIVDMIVKNVVGSLGQKFGISPQVATGIASSLIPQVLSKFAQQTANPNDPSIDMNGIIGALAGGSAKGVDFNDLLSQFTSGNGGNVDIAKVAGQLLSNQQGGAGGLLGTLSNLFGKK